MMTSILNCIRDIARARTSWARVTKGRSGLG